MYLREARLKALLLGYGRRRQARMRCAKQMAGVHIEGWDLCSRT